MSNKKEIYFLHSIRGKVIAAFIIGAMAIALSLYITRFGFGEMLRTVNELSAPNEKLQIVNNLFYKITQLDQLQKVHAIQNPDKPYEDFKKESQFLVGIIDTLRKQTEDNTLQIQRLDSMKYLLYKRDTLFHDYLKLRADFANNEDLSKRINDVSEFIAKSELKIDSSIINTNTRITSKIILPSDSVREVENRRKRQNFFGRLFGSRNVEELPTAIQHVEEELKVTIDTLFIARQDSAIWKIEKMMRLIEKEQHRRTTNLLNRELELINAESELHNQLLNIIHIIEAEEISLVNSNNSTATQVVYDSMNWINIIMIAFFVVTSILVFLIFIDISRSSKYRKELIAAKEEAEHLGQVKQRFLANMSHEIRTPLQSIIGYAEQVRQDENPKREALDAIYHSSEHLLHIVNEVLDYSRIVSGRFVFEVQPFEMKQLIHEVVETMRGTAEKKSIKLILIDKLSKSVFVEGDAFRLRQILFNLLGNAIKFTDIGQVVLSVSGKEMGPKLDFTFKIKDTGIGIPPQDIEKIFHVFEQANSSVMRTHGGTGLGLSIVKTLVENQKGKIKIHSKPGEGSEFIIDIPFGRATSKILVQDNAAKVKNNFKGKVAIVDDDAFILNLCSTILTKHSIEHNTFLNPFSILEREWDLSFKVVLLDIRMPQINGLELCQALRKKVPQNVKIYAVTAQALPEERETILKHGFDGILMKPYKEQELIDLLNHQEDALEIVSEEKIIPKCDLSILMKMVQGNEELLRNILKQFIAETQDDLKSLKNNIKETSREQVREVVHRLAGRTGQLGSSKLSYDLKKMEVALIGGKQFELLVYDLEVICIDLQVLIKEIEVVLFELQEA